MLAAQVVSGSGQPGVNLDGWQIGTYIHVYGHPGPSSHPSTRQSSNTVNFKSLAFLSILVFDVDKCQEEGFISGKNTITTHLHDRQPEPSPKCEILHPHYAGKQMDSLPAEIVCEILSHLAPSSRPSARLTSRLFNAILAPQSFPSVACFIDPDAALSKLESGAREARRRRMTSIWSPCCCVPCDIPIPHSFLLAAYIAFRGRQWQPRAEKTSSTAGEWDSDSGIDLSEDDVDCKSAELTVDTVVQGPQREDVTEETLRAAMFRYALYLSYMYRGAGEAPSLWVFNKKMWASKE